MLKIKKDTIRIITAKNVKLQPANCTKNYLNAT